MRSLLLITLCSGFIFSNCNQYGMLDDLESPGAAIGLRVFVSSAQTDGNFSLGLNAGGCSGNGVFRAICVCQHLANSAGLVRSNTQFISWLSETPTSDARCILQGQNTNSCGTNEAGPWYNIKRELVATSLAELLGGSLKNPIRYNEAGADMSTTEVYTGTRENGVLDTNQCSTWSTNTGIAAVGEAGLSGSGWTYKNTSGDCAIKRSIYCFEVKKQ